MGGTRDGRPDRAESGVRDKGVSSFPREGRRWRTGEKDSSLLKSCRPGRAVGEKRDRAFSLFFLEPVR